MGDTGDLDLTSFPLLRIDQISLHETNTLVRSEEELTALGRQNDESIESISPFVSKLVAQIRKELDNRGVKNASVQASRKETAASSAQSRRLPSTSYMVSPKRSSLTKQSAVAYPSHRKQGSNRQRQWKAAPPSQPSFFVSSGPNATQTSFLSRAKQAKASLQARSDEAISRQHEQERQVRTRQVLETMQDWRKEREKSKKKREELLEKERELRRQRWRERRAREEQVRESMHAAAEDAKCKALESGRTREEAIAEAAAAAAKVVDDESAAFHSVCSDSADEGSLIDDDDTDEETLPTKLTFDGAPCDESVPESQEYGKPRPSELTSNDDLKSCSSALNPGTCRGNIMTPAASCAEPQTELCDEVEPQTSCESAETDSNSTAESPPLHCSPDPTDPPTPQTPARQPLATACSTDEGVASIGSESGPGPEPGPGSTSSRQPAHPLQIITVEEAKVPPQTPDSHTAIDDEISIDDGQPRQRQTPERKFCSAFPSFSGIFTNLVNDDRHKCGADARQRDLSKSMQDQIARCTQFQKLQDTTHCSDDDDDESSDTSFEQRRFYTIKSRRPEVASIIRKAFSSHLLSSWEELPHDIEGACSNLTWVWGLPKASDFMDLLVFQKINRFRDTRGLTRKDLLKKNIQRFSSKAGTRDGDPFNIMPLTYALPHEFNSFVSGYQSIQKSSGNKATNIWIIKPVGLSRGRGISLVNDITEVSYSQPIVIQRYIADPLCWMGYKFDLRLYVLVTSFSPLEAFIYKEGLARFGSRQYSPRAETLHDHRIHLTNSSIQREYGDDIDKSHPAFLAGSQGADNKVAFSWLWKRLKGNGMDTGAMWLQICEVCRTAMAAAGSDTPHQPNSFEIFGFDLMFDQQQKCWLIEVNSSPSLSCDSPLDTSVKGSLVRDTILLVDPPAYDRKALADICKRRLTHLKSASNVSSKDVLEKDLAQILRKPPRQLGQQIRLGNFSRL